MDDGDQVTALKTMAVLGAILFSGLLFLLFTTYGEERIDVMLQQRAVMYRTMPAP